MGPTARILTWNIHGGIGSDRRYDLMRIIALIRRHEPDIVALQEVDSRGHDPHNLPIAALKSSLGSHAAEAKTIVAEDGHYGHVLISRWPMEHVQLHDLSIGRREPRCAIEAVIRPPQGLFRVVATHLGLGLGERRRQIARLVDLAGRHHEPEGCIMLGDFNDWHGEVRRALTGLMPAWSLLRTFPARRPIFKFDRIFCRPPGALGRCWSDPEAGRASDHLPVIAELQLEALADQSSSIGPPAPETGSVSGKDNAAIRATISGVAAAR
jgi:endonuclease/exonuclease/phosphatase family metal-dependent hydrolase